MIGSILKVPFFCIGKFLAITFGIIKLVIGLFVGVFSFVFNHLLGTIFGALTGLLLGKNHVGVKFFNHKKKKPSKK